VANLDKSTETLSLVLAKLEKGEGSLGALINERETVDTLNQTLGSLRDVTYKIKKGEGTIGRLVNDDTTVKKLDKALDGVNSMLSKADAMHVFVDWRGEYFTNENSWRSELNVRIQPKADKFYLLGVVYEPLGHRSNTYTETTYTLGDSTWTLVEDETSFGRTEVTVNAQIGKRFRDLTLRGGLFSSTGGFGIDYYLMDDKLKLSLEGFDFREEQRPRVRFAADYSFYKHFFVTVGVDNFVSEYDDTNLFLGAGMSFRDDDLKLILGSVPIPGF
jgi:phospholipid/cholesterol/gamma-HCH transport system substrate-binding protein